jgi:aminotransferase
MRVRILGGGVAGLSCAVALRRRAGVEDVRVYEQEPTASPPDRMGHGLILMQNGKEALRAIGAAGLLDGYTPLSRSVLQNEHGFAVRTESMKNVYCVTRAGIVNGLRAALPPDCLALDRHCHRVELGPAHPSGRRIRAVQFRAGPPLRGDDIDLFIGAEGWRSPMCDALNPGLERPLSRVMEVVTSTHLPRLAAQLGSVFVKTVLLDRGIAFGLLSPTPTRVIGFLQFDSERYAPPQHPASGADYQRFLAELLSGAPEPVPTYLRQADFDTAHLWRPVNADLPARLCCDNALLLGDAAHPLLPFTSQGVGAALEDAVMLADLLRPTAGDPRLLPGLLQGFCEDRRRDLSAFVTGGRRILANFLDSSSELVAPYVDGAASRLDRHLSLPRGGLRGLFRVLDLNGDGEINSEEFQQAMDLLELTLSEADAQALFRAIDTDGDGRLSVDELLDALAAPEGGPPLIERLQAKLSPRRVQLYTLRGRCKSLFRRMDADGDGALNADEFASSLLFLGSVLEPEAWNALFEELDHDGDGRIDLNEFLDGMTASQRVPALQPFADHVDEAEAMSKDLLFSDRSVDLSVLRTRAYNFRWAAVPRDTIPLTAADPDFPAAPQIIEAIQRYTSAGYLSYSPAEGLPELRDAAAQSLRARRGIDCDAGRVFVTDSAASALFLVARFAISEPGQEAIIADPVDFLFERSVAAAGGVVRRLPLRRGRGYSFDPDELEALIRPGKTRLLSICNPHNPLGRVFTHAELSALAEVALRHDLWIMSDEVWADIVYAPHAHTSIASLGGEVLARTFTILGFSKSYGLAGLRLGLLASPTQELHDAVVALSHARDTAYGVSTISQIAGLAAYQSAGDWLARFLVHLRLQRDYAVSRLNRMAKVRCHTPEGTYVVFPDVSGLGVDIEPLVADLKERHRVAVIPGSPAFFGPGAAGHIRLSFATSRQILSQGLDRIEAGLTGLGGDPLTGQAC